MKKRLFFLSLILFIILIVINVQSQNKSDRWRPIPFSDIQFKAAKVKVTTYDGKTRTKAIEVSDYYDVHAYAEIPRKFLAYLTKKVDCIFSIRTKDKSAFLSMKYDDKTGIIFGHVHHPDTQEYIYIGKGGLEGDNLKPIFLEETTFNFNPKAECGEFNCPGIKIILPYTYEELKRIFKEESKGTIK